MLLPETPRGSALADKDAAGLVEFPFSSLVCLNAGMAAARDATEATLGSAEEAALVAFFLVLERLCKPELTADPGLAVKLLTGFVPVSALLLDVTAYQFELTSVGSPE